MDPVEMESSKLARLWRRARRLQASGPLWARFGPAKASGMARDRRECGGAELLHGRYGDPEGEGAVVQGRRAG
jgi:hypothetical protein